MAAHTHKNVSVLHAAFDRPARHDITPDESGGITIPTGTPVPGAHDVKTPSVAVVELVLHG